MPPFLAELEGWLKIRDFLLGAEDLKPEYDKVCDIIRRLVGGVQVNTQATSGVPQ